MSKIIKKYQIGGGITTAVSGSPWGSIAGIADTVSGVLPENSAYKGKFGNITQGLDSIYDTASNVLMNVNPMIGGIMKAGKLLNKGVSAIGGGTDGMTRTDAWLSSNLLGLTPVGLINGFGGVRSDVYTRDMDIDANTGGSYQGFLSDEGEADYFSGKKYGLFSKSAKEDANNLIANINAQQIKLGTIEDTQDLNNKTAQSNQSFLSARQQLINSGGMNYARAGKEGMKISEVKFAKKVARNSKMRSLSKGKSIVKDNIISHEVAPDVPTVFKDGGKVNVIPEGALHKNKNHLEEVDEKFEDVTPKGIPVITEENGEVKQHAEVEKEEIIFRLEVTKKLEELMKKGTDEAAIEAGKLLVKEILHNTVDNANIINGDN